MRRTTITMDNDVAAAVERLRRERELGVSSAVNELIRRGLRHEPERRRFEQETSVMGARVDVTNVSEALEVLEGPSAP
jgi:Arc/MetJ family transcription regulator